MADVAAHIDLRGGFGEREVGRAHADLGVRAEHLAGEQEDGLLEVREGDVLVDIEALHLVEDAVRAGADGFVAEHAARADHADREGLGFHRTHLHGGGVGAEQERIQVAGGHEEGVLHLAGRVVRREVQGLEHVPVVLDLGAFRDVIAEFAEDVHDLLPDDGDGVAGTQFERVAGHRQVLLRREIHGGGRGLLLQLVDLRGDALLELVELLPILPLHLRGDAPELLHQRGDGALLAEEPYAGLFHFFLRGGLEFGQFLLYLFDGFFHGAHTCKMLKSRKDNYFPSFLSSAEAFSALALRLSRAFWLRCPVAFQYFFHWSSLKKRL